MDWITGIQRALDYTEAHLTEEIDYEEVAKQACSSSFHFQRMFGMLSGLSMPINGAMKFIATAEKLIVSWKTINLQI